MMNPQRTPSGKITHHWVIMGVSGSGKSVIGARLAKLLDVPFIDADDLHPSTNIEKMSLGIELTDNDRIEWLQAVGATLQASIEPSIVACSALKKAYRTRLREFDSRTGFIYLRGNRELIRNRLEKRTDHFMPLELLDSQFEALEPLEPNEYGFSVEIDQTITNITTDILIALTK